MKKLLVIVALLVAFSATPAAAVTDGALDGEGHPQVGLMVAFAADGSPLWRCSGTLMSETVYLTAGHCTESPAASARVWFDADVQNGIPGNGYGTDAGWTGGVTGTTYTHPDYDSARFWLYDLGVVVLDTPVTGVEYGELPAIDSLDKYQNKRRMNKLWFSSVGYGLQKAFPTAAGWKDVAEKIRMIAHPRLIQINVKGSTGRNTLLLTNNARTGGTCFGDSGGPNFIKGGLIVAGVTSFGKNGTCAGQGGVRRLDRDVDRDWLDSFFD